MLLPSDPKHPRHPAAQLSRVKAQWGGDKDLWVFGYGSLIWRREFEAVEERPATVYGWHRALEMLSILRSACGRFGTTLDYLVGTAASLRGCGIRDREIERLVALAREHALTA